MLKRVRTPPPNSLCLCLSLSLSIAWCCCLSLSLSPFVSLSVFASLCLPLSLSVSHLLSLCLSFCLSPCPAYGSVPVSVCLCLSLCNTCVLYLFIVHLITSMNLHCLSLDLVSLCIVSAVSPSSGDVSGDFPSPVALISLTAPKKCALNFLGIHFLGGRFLPE